MDISAVSGREVSVELVKLYCPGDGRSKESMISFVFHVSAEVAFSLMMKYLAVGRSPISSKAIVLVRPSYVRARMASATCVRVGLPPAASVAFLIAVRQTPMES